MASFFYFLGCVVCGWWAYNLFFPVFIHARGSVLSFLSGWLVGELVFHVMAVQALLTILFAMAGAIHGFWGISGVAITTISWVSMLHYVRISHWAEHEVEAALRTELGRDYRAQIRKRLKGHFPHTLNWLRLVKPHQLDLPNVERIRDIIYGKAENIQLKLDIYRRNDQPDNCPVLFQIHGGAWTYRMGSKNEQARPLMNYMASLGWVCVSIEYRLSPQFSFPAHIIDCKRALAWTKAHIAEYGGNPDFIVATGGSAGGHLSALLALTANDPAYQPGFESADTRVQGCVPFYGVYDFTDAYGLQANDTLARLLTYSVMKKTPEEDLAAFRNGSPIFRVHADAPPFFIIQGASDTLVSLSTARKFVEVLRKNSGAVVGYVELSGAQHAFDMFPSIRSEHVKHGVARFLAWLYSAYLDGREAHGARRALETESLSEPADTGSSASSSPNDA